MFVVCVYGTQCGITILQPFSNDAYRTNIKKLLKSKMLFLHLFPDTVDMLRAAVDFRFNMLVIHQRLQIRHDILNVGCPLFALTIQLLSNIFIGFRMQVAESQVFQFPL